jgi:hypothetical protein
MNQGPLEQPDNQTILAALREAGWLLEQETQTALREASFEVVPGFAFPDPDDGSVSREIDVFGQKTIHIDEALRVMVRVSVLVECKQSRMPYVLIGRATDDSVRNRPRAENTLRFPSVEVRRDGEGTGSVTTYSVPGHQYLGLDQAAGSPWTDPFEANQMTRLDFSRKRWEANNETIFTSLVYPLAKAVTHLDKHLRQLMDMSLSTHDPSRYRWAYADFRFPVVVTSSPIYSVNVGEEPIEPRPVPWGTMTRHIRTQSVDGLFHVDVVSYEHLPAYLDERVGKLAQVLEQIPVSRFVTHADLKWGEAHPEHFAPA